MSKTTLFRVVNVRSGATMAYAELPSDQSLLQELFTDELHLNVPYGDDYTMVPLDSPFIDVLKDLYACFLVLGKPNRYVTVLHERQDRLVSQVELLFSQQERIKLDTKDDVAQYIVFLRGKAKPDYVLPLVQRHVLGELAAEVTGSESAEEASGDQADDA